MKKCQMMSNRKGEQKIRNEEMVDEIREKE